MLATELTEGFRIAAGTLWSRKLRALLTTLGIVIGIVSVTSMFTVINGIEGAFNRSMSIIGDDALFVQKTGWFDFGEWWETRNRPEITDDLVPFLRARATTLAAAAPITGGGDLPVTRGRDEAPGVSVTASTAAYVDTGGQDVSAGRFFSDGEADAGRAVVVVGADIAEALFPAEDPVGKDVRIGTHRFEVVGVTAKRGSFLGMQSADNDAVMPIRTYRRLFSSAPGRDGQAARPRRRPAGPRRRRGAEPDAHLARGWTRSRTTTSRSTGRTSFAS